MLKQSLKNGSLYITEDVLCIITSICVQECNGIEIIKLGIREGIFQKISSNYSKKGVSIYKDSDEIEIEVRVAVNVGINVLDTCYHLQRLISEEIKEVTGIYVEKIHIRVEQILMDKPDFKKQLLKN